MVNDTNVHIIVAASQHIWSSLGHIRIMINRLLHSICMPIMHNLFRFFHNFLMAIIRIFIKFFFFIFFFQLISTQRQKKARAQHTILLSRQMSRMRGNQMIRCLYSIWLVLLTIGVLKAMHTYKSGRPTIIFFQCLLFFFLFQRHKKTPCEQMLWFEHFISSISTIFEHKRHLKPHVEYFEI